MSKISLARLSLVHDWLRYLPAVLAVAFAGLLILVQIGLMLGQLGTVTSILDEARADLWVVAENTESFDLAREMPNRHEARLRMHPEVVDVQDMLFGVGDWRTPDGGKVFLYLIGVDIAPGSLSFPRAFPESLRTSMAEIDGVVIDAADVDKFGTGLGQISDIDQHRVKVVGITEGFRAIGAAYVFGAIETVRPILQDQILNDHVQYFLVELEHPERAAEVRDQLQADAEKSSYRVYTPEEFSLLSKLYWLRESGAGASVAFSALLAMIVGIAITGQTLRGAILASIKEFATLRALGAPVRSLRSTVLEQAFWVGLAGLTVTCTLAVVILAGARVSHVAIAFPWWALLGASLFMVSVALLSGVFALKPLYQTEPADLLR